MQCPESGSTNISKNGKQKGKQNHICKDCRRQFVDTYAADVGYSDDVKRLCLRMYVNGSGFRSIERVTGVHHPTVITWVRKIGQLLPDAYAPETADSGGRREHSLTSLPWQACIARRSAILNP